MAQCKCVCYDRLLVRRVFVLDLLFLVLFLDCGTLSNPENGLVFIPGGTTYGQTATYSCTGGNSVIGAASVTCQADGSWSSAPPTCRQTCM